MLTTSSHIPSALDVDSLRPYVSGTVLKSLPAGATGQDLVKSVMADVKAVLATKPAKVLLEEANVAKFNGIYAGTIIYSETSTPAWAPTSSLEDLVHHSISVLARDHWCLLVSSDSTFRKTLVAEVKVAKPLSRKEFSRAFVGPAAKAMWLDGVHSHSRFKADGKLLLGAALENAVDPLGDHTFAMSAIRSQPKIKNLKDVVIGASLSSRSLWIGRATSWADFIVQVKALFSHLDRPPKSTTLYSSLAQPIDDLSSVTKAHEIAILPSVLLGDDAALNSSELASADYWANKVTYKVKAGSGADFDVEVKAGSQYLGEFFAKVSKTGLRKIKISGKWSSKDAVLALQRKECERLLTDPEQIKIYYDSGHTISFGECFQSGWTDQLFDWTFVDFKGFKVENEKPNVPPGKDLADVIGDPNDDSLFGFIQKKMFTKGWLACDDGSMELADFVHFDPVTGQITLIHAKGSGNDSPNREVSVADYELVVSQGVKNIRHLRISNLIKKLEDGESKKIASAVWLDGSKQINRKGLIAELKKFPDSAPRKLIILQPRLTRKEQKYCMGVNPAKDRLLRFQQLNALVLSGRLSAMAAGADFAVVTAK